MTRATRINRLPGAASRFQDSTIQALDGLASSAFSAQETANEATKATAPGTIAAGVEVLVALPSGYSLVAHNLGRVARGFIVTGQTGAAALTRDSADPGAPFAPASGLASRNANAPTGTNPTPTKTIRLSASGAGVFQLWIY